MYIQEYLNKSIPQLRTKDSVSKVLQLMNDFKISHLPLVHDGKYLGMLSEDDLTDFEEENPILENLSEFYLKGAVLEDSHFLSAAQLASQLDWTVVPVIQKDEDYLGCVTQADLLKLLSSFSGADHLLGVIVVECEQIHFSISEISRIVESNNAKILHLNTVFHPTNGKVRITIHINKKELTAIAASFQRYDYNIVFALGSDEWDADIEDNYNHLMNYLNI